MLLWKHCDQVIGDGDLLLDHYRQDQWEGWGNHLAIWWAEEVAGWDSGD